MNNKQEKPKCIFCTGEQINPYADASGNAQLWKEHQYHQQKPSIPTMNKETKSKCCNVPSNYSQIPELCCACGKPFIPQEDTPVTPIEGKKLRYQINKIRNGCWRLEWEDGSFSEHSTQDGAERMRMQIETSRASHPIEPSWEEQYNKLFDRHFQAKYSDIKAFIHSVEKAAEEKAKEGIIQDILELCRYNGEIQSVDILKYAKANGISLQVK